MVAHDNTDALEIDMNVLETCRARKSRGYNSAPMFSCPYCENSEESIKHFLLECKHFEAQRSILLNVEGRTYETNSIIVTYIRDIYETRRQTQQV